MKHRIREPQRCYQCKEGNHDDCKARLNVYTFRGVLRSDVIYSYPCTCDH